MKVVPPSLRGGVPAGLLQPLDAEERASRGLGVSIPWIGSEHPTAGRSQSPSTVMGLVFFLATVHWGNGFELMRVVISRCAWETLVIPRADVLRAEDCR